MVVVQELSDSDISDSTVAERLIRNLSNDVTIFTTDEAHFHLSGCQQTEFSLLCRGRSTAAPLTASSQCTCDCLVWSGKLRSQRPLFLWRRRWACSYRHICSLCWNVTNFPTPELSSRPYGSSKMAQLPVQREHPWRSFGNISGAHYFTAQRASTACTFAWSLCLWLCPLGISQSESVYH
jgi:hypothetical protein